MTKKRHLHLIKGDYSYKKKKMDYIESILEARRLFYKETGKRLMEFIYISPNTEKGLGTIKIKIEGDLGHMIIGTPHNFDYGIEKYWEPEC